MFNAPKVCIALLVLAVTGAVVAQPTLERPVGEFVPYTLDSGAIQRLGGSPVIPYQETVHVESAASLRLYFDRLDLDGDSYIRITSESDGEVQELDAYEAEMWNYSSAYFNGDTVYLELIAAPASTKNRVVLGGVAAEFYPTLRGPCEADDCGMCNGDDRVLSFENWTGRLMPVGCTGSVYSTSSCVVTAGHCAAGGGADIIQFNVPLSLASCATVNPPVADQFPITGYLFDNGGVGNDWAVLTTGTNNLGEQPYERYGELRPIAPTPVSGGSPIAIWGYGSDNDDTTHNAVQQTDSGNINAVGSRTYSHNVDITYGNSGSALIHNGQIVGVATNCSFSCSNIATRIDVPGFAAAREQLCGADCDVTFNNQPTASQLVCDGEAVQLSVDVQDAQQMSFQWRRGGADLVDDGVHISGATTATLSIADFGLADEDSDYHCIVTNPLEFCSAASDYAEVLVDTNLPVITQQPSSQIVTEGDPVIFLVTANDAVLMSFQWRKDGAPLTDGSGLSGATTSTLIIVSTISGDAGNYDCVVTYSLGAQCSTTSDTATLTVNSTGNDCPEDLNGDGTVGLADLSTLLANYGASSGMGPEDGDFDGDGDIDLSDLSTLLAVYGQDCPTQ